MSCCFEWCPSTLEFRDLEIRDPSAQKKIQNLKNQRELHQENHVFNSKTIQYGK